MVLRIGWVGIVLWASVAFGQGSPRPLHHDVLRLTPPLGWTTSRQGSALCLMAPDRRARLILERSQAFSGHLDVAFAAGRQAFDADQSLRRNGEPVRERASMARAETESTIYLREAAGPSAEVSGLWLLQLAGGGRVIALRFEFDALEAYERHAPEVTALANTARLSTLERLARGRPALTRFMVDEITAFLEWLLQAPFTDEQMATVEAELVRAWRERDREEIDGTLEVLKAREDLSALSVEEREASRLAILEQALQGWKDERAESEGAALMLAIHESANRILAEGRPPLRRQAVAAVAEFFHFAACEAKGLKLKLSPKVREQLEQNLIAGWAQLEPSQREFVANMPLNWASLRVQWPVLSPTEREAMIAAWRATPAIVSLAADLEKAQAEETAAQTDNGAAGSQSQAGVMQEAVRLSQETRRLQASTFVVNVSFGHTYRW